MALSSAQVFLSILVSRVAAVLVMLVGASVLAGWTFNVPALKSIAPNLVSMTANTALCLSVTGWVLFVQGAAASKLSSKRIGNLLALFAVAISSLSLLEYITNLDFGIDEFLFVDDTRATADHPGRMAPVTAISLLFCNLALLLAPHSRVSRYLAIAVLFLGALATIGYLFGVSSLYQVIGYASVAVHTAVSLMLISLGILASRPQHGMLAIILSDTAGGEMARRLLWMIPLMSVVLNWLVLQGETTTFYDNRFGLAISCVGGIALSWGVILMIAHRLHLADSQRQQALQQLTALNSSLERRVIKRTQELTFANEKLAKEISERKQAEEKVYQLSLTDELSGLLNRRGFLLLAEQALKTARRAQTELTLIYVDLDGLKRVNDELGHQAGDTMIVETAQLLRVSFRESDLIGRLGGDEFALLAISTDSPEFMLARLQDSLVQFNKIGSLPYPLSFSVGHVQCLPLEEKSLFDLLADADRCMYLQKQDRRAAVSVTVTARPA
jgi:diguanylate cyclase (GGDEF)-like protein